MPRTLFRNKNFMVDEIGNQTESFKFCHTFRIKKQTSTLNKFLSLMLEIQSHSRFIFLYSRNMANFEAFRLTISSSINLLNLWRVILCSAQVRPLASIWTLFWPFHTNENLNKICSTCAWKHTYLEKNYLKKFAFQCSNAAQKNSLKTFRYSLGIVSRIWIKIDREWQDFFQIPTLLFYDQGNSLAKCSGF